MKTHVSKLWDALTFRQSLSKSFGFYLGVLSYVLIFKHLITGSEWLEAQLIAGTLIGGKTALEAWQAKNGNAQP